MTAPATTAPAAVRGRRRALDPTLAVALVVAVVFVLVAIVWPIGSVVVTSMTADALPIFQRYLTPPQGQIMINTVVLGLIVGSIGTLIGFLFAYVQVRVPAPRLLKRSMHVLALVPIVSPPFALALSAIILFGRSGLITRDLLGIQFDIYGLPGLILVMSLSFFPVAYITLTGLLRAIDPALDEAAISLGGGRWHTFRTVTLPLLLPGLASAFLLIFVETLADLGNPIALGGNYEVLTRRLYFAIIGQYDLLAGAVLGILLLVPSLVVYFVHRYYAERASVIAVTGKPSGRPAELTHRVVGWMLVGVAGLISLLVVLMYGTILLGAFTKLVGVDHTLTTKNFEFVLFGYGLEAVSDTVILAAVATPLAGVLGVVVAFLVVRGRFRGRGAIDFGTMLGVAVPGTVFGIGYLLTFNTPTELGGVTIFPKLTGNAGLLGGAVAIVLVFIVRSAPGGLRSGAAALQQIDPTIEEASISLGADQATTFRRVVLPLIRPAFLTGLIYSFARSMTAISAVIFLTTPSTRIMTQQILNETNAARFGNAFAYCVILIVIVCLAIGVLYAVIGTSTRTDTASDPTTIGIP